MERVCVLGLRGLSSESLFDETFKTLDLQLHVGSLIRPLFHVDCYHLLELRQVFDDDVDFL